MDTISPQHLETIKKTVNSIFKKTNLYYSINTEDVKNDMYQSAYLAALEAYKKYKDELSNTNIKFEDRFFNYAYFQIYNALIKEYCIQAKGTPYKYYYNKHKVFNEIKHFVNKYNEEHKYFPEDDIVIKKFGIEKDIYLNRIKPYLLMLNTIQEISLNINNNNDQDLSLLEVLKTNDFDKVEKDIYKKQIIDKILKFNKSHFTEKVNDIFKMRFGLEEFSGKEHTYKEIGEKYNISQERVRQILVKVIKDVKEHLKQVHILEENQELQN